MIKLDEILTEAKDVFADELEEGYMDNKDDVVNFAVEEADMYLEKLDNEDKLNLLIEIDKDGYELKHFELLEVKTLQEAIDGAVGTHLSSKLLTVAEEVWDASN